MKRILPILILATFCRSALLAQPDPTTVYAWFKADEGPLTNGAGTVTNWQNQATMGTPASRNLDQYSGTPTLVPGAAPNLIGSSVRFLGAGGPIHYLRGTGANFGTLPDARTVVVYCKVLGFPSGGGFLFDGATPPGLTRVQTDNTKWQVGVTNTGRGYNTPTLTFQTNVWQVHAFSFNRTNNTTAITHHIFGGGTFSFTSSSTNALSGLILGQPNNPSTFYGLSVDFAELLVYDRLLTGAEATNVFGYLTNKWAPPVPTLQSGAYAWFKADVGVMTNAAGSVTNWRNQAVTGTPTTRDLNVPGVAPSYVANAVGTNPVIRFDGSQNIFAPVGSFGVIGTNRTLVAALKLTSTNGGFLFDGSTGSGMNRAQIRDGSWQAGIQPLPLANGANADPATLGIVPATWQTHFFNFEPVTGGTRVTHSEFNGASVTYTNANTNNLGGLILGENVAQSFGLAVDIGEFLVYDRSLTTNEQQDLGTYLAGRWLTTLPPPVLIGISPTNGTALGGTTVTLTGSNFAPGLAVKFGGSNAVSVAYSNATLATAITPGAAPGLVDVEVRNADDQFSVLSNAFAFDPAPAPAITSVFPTNGSTVGGAIVTLAGSNFSAGVTVEFDGVAAASVTYSNSTLVTATTPALPEGMADVRATNPDAQFFVASNAFTAVGPPVLPPAAASVYAWYKGDSSLTVGGDNYSVISWANAGTASTNATFTQAGRNLSQLSGVPQKTWLRLADNSPAAAVQFRGSDGIWAAQGAFGTLAGDRTLVACLRVSNAIPQGFLFDSSSYSVGLTRAQVNGGDWQVSVYDSGASGSSAAPGTVTAPVATNTWQVHTFVITTNSAARFFRHYINGTLAGLVTNAVPGALGGLILGQNASAAVGIRAEIAEWLVFNSALDDASRGEVENYLSDKWDGVTADPAAPEPPTYLPFVRVFEGGVDGYTCFRIPAIVTTTNGTVIAMSDGRIGSCGDIPTPLDLVIKRSFDNGVTWGPLQVVTDYGTATGDVDDYPFYGLTNVTRVASGDAALLLDRTNGRIWTLYDNGGISGSRKIKLEMKYSDDDGATWSPRIDVETDNPGIRPGYGEFLAGPGNGIQLSEGPAAGRLIFPVYSFGSPSASMVIYSDDHGATWQRSANAVTNGGEIQVAELPGGNLLASMRDNGFPWSGVRTFALSTNGGMTWSLPYTNTISPPTIPDPACQGNIYRLTTTNDSNASRLVHANAASPSSRVNMTLRISYDEGQTWPVSNQVYAAGSAYSSVTKLANGDIGLLFEKDPYGNLDFARRSVFEITGGADSLPAYDVWAGQQFTPAQLSNPAISGPNADPDEDGHNNHEEFMAGTDPLSALSTLQLNIGPGTAGVELGFSGVSNKSYTIQYRDGLNTGTWQPFTNIGVLSSNTAVAVPVTVTNDSQFFRLATPQLP